MFLCLTNELLFHPIILQELAACPIIARKDIKFIEIFYKYIMRSTPLGLPAKQMNCSLSCFKFSSYHVYTYFD